MDERNMYHLRNNNLNVFKDTDYHFKYSYRFEPTNHKEIEIIENNIIERNKDSIEIETYFKDKLTNKHYKMVELIYFDDKDMKLLDIEEIKPYKKCEVNLKIS